MFVGASGVGGHVEFTIENEKFRDVNTLLDTLLDRLNLGDLCRTKFPHALDERERFKPLTHSIEGLYLTRIEDRNASALVRLGLDQSFGGEHPQGFTNR